MLKTQFYKRTAT